MRMSCRRAGICGRQVEEGKEGRGGQIEGKNNEGPKEDTTVVRSKSDCVRKKKDGEGEGRVGKDGGHELLLWMGLPFFDEFVSDSRGKSPLVGE